MADAKAGLELNRDQFERAIVDDQSYWFSPVQDTYKHKSPHVCLLPPYDEYLVAYKDRRAAIDAATNELFRIRNPIFDSPLMLNGRVIGGWKRTIKNDSLAISISAVTRLSRIEKMAINDAVHRYAAFLGSRRFELNL
jgi:hypothetical protein